MLIIRQQYFDENQYWLTNRKVKGFSIFVALHYTFFTVKLKFKSAANTEVSGFSTTLLI